MRKFKHDLLNKHFQLAVEKDEGIEKQNSWLTYSQTGQDLFVIAMLQGKSKGTFLELGCQQPKYSNNTFVLEKFFMFTGVSIDINYDEHWPGNRHLHISEKSWPLCRPSASWFKADALTFDYSSLSDYYDYLQVDLDPAINSFEALKQVCNNKKFAVITFEHDDWDRKSSNLKIKQHSREFLLSLGYQLVVGDVGFNDTQSYEDWWAHPDFVDQQVINAYKQVDGNVKNWQRVLFTTN